MQTYEEFINNILESRGRFACGNEYCERHHILPKCCDGTDNEDNLIDLFAREHFEAHRLLALENPENKQLVYAWWMMSHVKSKNQDRREITPEEYEESRMEFCKFMNGENNPMYGKYGEDNPNYGRHHSEEEKQKMSESLKGKMVGENNPMYGVRRYGENNPMYGKKHSEETKRQIGDKAKERYKDKTNNPNYGNHKLAGANHPKARKVIRLLDFKIYDCATYASADNNLSNSTMCYRCKQRKGFMYYDEWISEHDITYLSL